MPPSYREEVTSIGSLVFLEIARKVLVKLIRKNTEISRAVGKNTDLYAWFEEKYSKVVASKTRINPDITSITRNKAWKSPSRYEGGMTMLFIIYDCIISPSRQNSIKCTSKYDYIFIPNKSRK